MGCGLDQRERGREGSRQGPVCGRAAVQSRAEESRGGFMDMAESTGSGGGWAPRFLVWEVGARGGAIHRAGTLRKRCGQVREEKPCTGSVPVP